MQLIVGRVGEIAKVVAGLLAVGSVSRSRWAARRRR
jgi:hypothetical protein